MFKLILAFAVFAVIALYVIFKAGDKVDMSGEKHGMDAHPPGASAPATAASAVPMAPASAASQ